MGNHRRTYARHKEKEEERALTHPKSETVNVVTIGHGEDFAEAWFEGTLEDACDKTDILAKWLTSERRHL